MYVALAKMDNDVAISNISLSDFKASHVEIYQYEVDRMCLKLRNCVVYWFVLFYYYFYYYNL